MNKISVAIATYNEEKNLLDCLETVSGWVDEIVIVDGGSTDQTVEIAKKYKAKIIESDNPIIFHLNKQKAIAACSSAWILQLDADERATSNLYHEIAGVINNPKTTLDGYYLSRKNYLLGKEMKKGGLYPDYVIRLFKNGQGRFPCKTVHEQIEINGKVGYLKEPLIHLAYPGFSQYLKKADTYTSLTAYLMAKQKIKIGCGSLIYYFFLKPWKTFLTLYIRHQGFLDGFPGFVWAFFSALHFPTAFVKYWETKKMKNEQ